MTIASGSRSPALVHQPAILILDEATSALDAMTEREIVDNLAELHCTQRTA